MNMPKQPMMDNAVKLLGEAFVPGASLLMDGKIVEGSIHLVAGTWAKAAIGPIGWALVVANSYSESVTWKNLLKHLSKAAQDVQAGPTRQEGHSQG